LNAIFAFWAVRSWVERGSWVDVFHKSKADGLASFDKIARLYAPRMGLLVDEVHSYLCGSLDYSLSSENLEGLELFLRLAVEWEEAYDFVPLRLLD
jgi:predicted solute-binding protein